MHFKIYNNNSYKKINQNHLHKLLITQTFLKKNLIKNMCKKVIYRKEKIIKAIV